MYRFEAGWSVKAAYRADVFQTFRFDYNAGARGGDAP